MSEQKKRTPTRVIVTRLICGILAFLMVGSIIYSSIVLLFFK